MIKITCKGCGWSILEIEILNKENNNLPIKNYFYKDQFPACKLCGVCYDIEEVVNTRGTNKNLYG